MEMAKLITGKNSIDPYMLWTDIGDNELRQRILDKAKLDLESEFGFEVFIPDRLLEFDGPVESVANQVHHSFSTIFLVEKINAKIVARRQN